MRISYADAIRQAMCEAMDADPDVFIMGEDIGKTDGSFGVTKGMYATYGPDRVWDTPISEAAIVGAVVGASLVGGHPIAEIMFGDFATLTMDQIVNQAAKIRYMTGGAMSAPVVVRMVTGTAGATAAQHSQSLESWFVHAPGVKVVAPSTARDAKALMAAALADPDPVVFFEHKALYETRAAAELTDDAAFPVEPVALGSARIAREGTDVTIVSYLKTLYHALEAAELLAAEGISCEVLDPRSLVPFDRAALGASLARTGRLVVAHEAPVRGGFGAEIAAIASEDFFDLLTAPVVRVGAQNAPIPYAPVLENTVIPGTSRIADAVRGLLGLTPRED